ncbi:hypothetical protein HOLleu_39314 [Holothuria leucospilota]|uniref:Secreted protein n=1 Tax=Holothuria leucospilota TaxID=206669 RepID=A0A9Q1BES6_HOLLE|nr:hypothetical protein HOLleu_39314 [Holothuria leucospilota]
MWMQCFTKLGLVLLIRMHCIFCGGISQAPLEDRINVHLFRGPWSPSCCAFALRHTAEESKALYSSSVYDAVMHNFM